MLTQERIEEILRDSGALLEGHFILTSGRHAGRYMQCAKILQYPNYTQELTGHLKQSFKDDGVQMVIAPAVGGIVLGYELARQLGVQSIFTEREDGKMVLRRGFEIPAGTKVLVAEDVVTTGGSVKEVIEVAKAAGAVVVGVALLVDRSGGTVDFGTKCIAAYTTAIASYEPENCPLCKGGAIQAIKPGSRAVK
ncbi:MAG: orotate phosphoribosyltransferase [Defluviitaleaceae bacterium]|nr:orotate phosphoribosyltransferase [Defluviitaleaceae bacterium]